MKIVKEFVLRNVAGETILVPVGNTSLHFNGLITLNEVGTFLWEILQSETDIKSMVEKVLADYDVDEETATRDVTEFVEELTRAGIIE